MPRFNDSITPPPGVSRPTVNGGYVQHGGRTTSFDTALGLAQQAAGQRPIQAAPQSAPPTIQATASMATRPGGSQTPVKRPMRTQDLVHGTEVELPQNRRRGTATIMAHVESCDGNDYDFKKIPEGGHEPEDEVKAVQMALLIVLCEIAKGADPQQAANHILSRYGVRLLDSNGKTFYHFLKASEYQAALQPSAAPALAPGQWDDEDGHFGTDGLSLPDVE